MTRDSASATSARPRASGDPVLCFLDSRFRGNERSIIATAWLASRLEPRAHGFDQHLAQAGMLDALDRIADEGQDQERLGFGMRNAARAQIEQEILIEIARG